MHAYIYANSVCFVSPAVPSIYKNALKRQQMVLWRDKEKGTRLLVVRVLCVILAIL